MRGSIGFKLLRMAERSKNPQFTQITVLYDTLQSSSGVLIFNNDEAQYVRFNSLEFDSGYLVIYDSANGLTDTPATNRGRLKGFYDVNKHIIQFGQHGRKST